jgi:putative ABC transport system permease protein
MKQNLLLRVLLAIINAARWLAPPSRRREWRRQWRADISHEWNWLERNQRGVVGSASLARRATGAFRHAFGLRRIERITQDLRYGWRQMLRRPGVTIAAIVTLGLGIGANVTMYSWMDGRLRVVLEGVDRPDRLVALNDVSKTHDDLSVSYPTFADYRQRLPESVDDLVAYSLAPMNWRAAGDPQRVFGQMVSGNFFTMLGVSPVLGRTFAAEDDATPDRNAVVVLSYNFWQRRLAGNPSIVGTSITLNGRAFTVVGVAREGFHGTEPFLNLDFWVPLMMQKAVTGTDRLAARGDHWLEVLVRLKPGVSLARAQADLSVVERGIAAKFPKQSFDGIKLWELWRAPGMGGGAIAAVMGMQLAVAGVVLLIACANVANLLLAGAAARQRETAVRLTLGASRSRLVQQMLTENLLLAVAGGAAGLLVAYWTKDLAQLFIPPAPLPIEIHPTLNRVVLLFAAGVTTATAFIFGLMPAVQASASSVMSALKASSGTVTASRGRARVRKALVVAQVALSLVLLVSAGLFIRTLANAQSVDPGFSARSGIIAAIDLLPAGYDQARGLAFDQQLVERVREIPDVRAATLIQRMPLGFGSGSSWFISVDGYAPSPNEEMLVNYNRVGDEHFQTLGIRLLEGREFTRRDTNDTPGVTVINETMARRYFAGRDPIGGRIHIGTKTVEVVGVARDGKYSSVTERSRAYMYVPLTQWYRPDVVLVATTRGDPGRVVPALHAAVRSLDANVPLFDVRTLEEHLEISIFVQRMIASMLGAFGLLALVLAMIGVYGVMATMASQRTSEIGMRMALGARRFDITTLILRQAFGMIGIGVAIGLAAAFGATRFFASLLVGVSATDTLSFAATTALLLIVGLVATYLPARRAASISPLTALRNE